MLACDTRLCMYYHTGVIVFAVCINIYVQYREQVFATFLISSGFAYLSHLIVSDPQTQLHTRQRQPEKTQNTDFKSPFPLLNF